MRLIKENLFLYILIFNSLLLAKTPGDDQVWAGVNAFYNYETARAIRILTQARHDYPDNPTVHLTWAAARWLHSQANESIEKTYRTLADDLEEIIPVYEKLIAKYPDSPVYQLYLGSAIGLKARVHLGKKEWLSTLTSAYKGFKIIRGVAKNNPDLIDAQLPIGIVEYYAAMSNIIIRWAVDLFGLESTREAGLAKIELAANQGDFAWIEAKSICSFLYLWVDPNPPKALTHSQILIEHFPDNYYFNILQVESLIKTGRYSRALELLKSLEKKLFALTPIQQRWYSGYLRYEWGLYYFQNKDYEKALLSVNEAIRVYNAELDIILANAWLLKGKLLDLKGDRNEAQIAYRQCIDLDNQTAAIPVARRLIEKPYKSVN